MFQYCQPMWPMTARVAPLACRLRTESDEGVLMKVIVDFDQCEANGICVGIAPDVFELDDEDQLHIRVAEVPADRLADVEDAVAQCPKAALRLG
ncbi:hypothetical protein F5544_02895 [Nocardia arthritidis]|uniref:Ferredoxin n=2 Tax=Nocardiaceae TaxID=85025 RepID=A0A6G9Y5N5_9NOCA|nr:hypothetical protein F5544_02895 [Nocardia arthritidis]